MAVPDTILVARAPGETRYALLAGDEVIEIAHRRDADIQPGTVYAGRIGAGVPGVAAVFVDIGDAVPGVLALKGRAPPQGSAVAVVVIVPPRADKGAELKISVVKIPEGGKAPQIIAAAPEPATVWWECYRDGIARVRCAPRREVMRVKALLGTGAPVEEGAPDFFGVVDDAIDAALNSTVALPGGGSLIIEHTAAVTAIDVNSGAGDPSAANGDAVPAVAAALRQRNIAGHIVVDFIPSRHRSKLARSLADAVSPDAVATNVAGISPLGLVELTRKRAGLSLAETLCDARGQQSVATVAYGVLRDALRFAHSAKAARVTASVAPEVAAVLQGRLRAAFTEAEGELKGEIALKARAEFMRTRTELA